MEAVSPRVFAFAGFRFDAETGELTGHSRKLRLPRQCALLLSLLIERRGELVTREDARQRLWPNGEWVDYDHSINKAIGQLRTALRDDRRAPRFVETLPKRGFRFLPKVETLGPATSTLVTSTSGTSAVIQSIPSTGIVAKTPEAPRVEPAPRSPRSSRVPWIIGVGLSLVAATAGIVLLVKAPAHGGTVSPQAYEIYLRARYHLSQRTDESMLKAVGEFDSAITADPSFAKAYSGLAHTYSLLFDHDIGSSEDYRKAQELATKAIQIDPMLAEAHATAGYVALRKDCNLGLAEQELRRATELAPDDPDHHASLALVLASESRFEEALHEIDQSHAADPAWSTSYFSEVYIAAAARKTDRMLEASRTLLERLPDQPRAHTQRGWALWYAGRGAEAIAQWHAAASMLKDAGWMALEERGSTAFRSGGIAAYARVRLEAMKTRTQWPDPSDFDPAEWYLNAGNREEALAVLEAKVANHDPDAFSFAAHPAYFDLHGDPRFQALLTRLGIAAPLLSGDPAIPPTSSSGCPLRDAGASRQSDNFLRRNTGLQFSLLITPSHCGYIRHLQTPSRE